MPFINPILSIKVMPEITITSNQIPDTQTHENHVDNVYYEAQWSKTHPSSSNPPLDS